MKNIFKNNKDSQKGFLQIIILILIALILMKFLGITVSGIFDAIGSFFLWLGSFFRSVFR